MATGAPGTNGVWLYGEDDSEATFSQLLNKAGTTVNTQLGLDRGRLTTLEARPVSGLVPISPASVVIAGGSGSTTALGQVNFSNATSVSLNNVFSTTYRAYRVTMSLTLGTGAQLTYMRMRVNNADNTGTYVWGYNGIRTNGTANGWTSTGNSTAGICVLNAGATGPQTTSFDIYNPGILGPATTWGLTGYWADSVGAYGAAGAGLHADGAVFTGFTIYPGGSNISGSIHVFGYND